jgi:hypothetical protein
MLWHLAVYKLTKKDPEGNIKLHRAVCKSMFEISVALLAFNIAITGLMRHSF